MMQVIRCETCGGDTIPLGGISVDLTLNKSEFCNHCYRTKTDKQEHFFCSLLCFHEYMLKLVNGETELKWKERFPPIAIEVKT
jgi:hypothetical protein